MNAVVLHVNILLSIFFNFLQTDTIFLNHVSNEGMQMPLKVLCLFSKHLLTLSSFYNSNSNPNA